ncbi:ABC transporter substrate-binding protein [Pelagibius litoralis]|uniref:ABC transporter substrate-binding protein n=1 Tax=Pelagibius litoralis TaxID=374515 RepID=A0A967F093_9PROT|nr:ABC transporter substrate-binding protein [Pelagibius litoralis]NIA70645.1 ABC transporter substrate-binding protein [Pelagibius litoralis]
MRKSTFMCAVSLAAVMASPVAAQELKIGLSSEPSALDPHFHNLGPNNAMRRHMYDSMVLQDESQQLKPGLATSWKPTDDTTWEFTLRQGVTFHDGSPFTARDVVYTVCRIPAVEDSPSSFTVYTKAIAGLEVKDDHTLIVKTDKPYPLLPVEVSTWGVLSATANGVAGDITFSRDGCSGTGDFPKTQAFNDGSKANGTGPFKFKEFTRGEKIVLERNESYWGDKPAWQTVTFRPITSNGPRVAALLAGDVDMIDKPPLQDLERIKSEGFEVAQGLSNRVIYLHFDHEQEPTPGIDGTGGKNPFKDMRVREAVSKAINREAIVARIMGGVAVPAGELLPQGMFGSTPGAEHDGYDPDGAKKLLADAGYGDGFKLVLGSPNDRYINDAQIAQAVAQMLARVGITTEVDAMTKSTFFARRNKYEFSLYMAGWGSGTGEMSSPLRALVATRDKEKGMGGTNRGRYSNPELDAMIEKALATVDDDKREAILREASQVAMKNYAILPLHYEVTPWAYRKGLSYTPRTDQYTIATGVTPAN